MARGRALTLPAPAPAPAPAVDGELFAEAAMALVDGGRFVPGLTIDEDGRGRSWWWPLPAVSDRGMIAALVPPGADVDAQRAAAGRLAAEVDRLVRGRLVGARIKIAPPRAGRPTVVESWARALVSADPWLPASQDRAKVAALAAALGEWAASGAVVGGSIRLCLRVHEPVGRRDSWRVELLAQDRDESSLMVPLVDVWEGHAPFRGSVVEDTLVALARAARLAPELAGALEQRAPTDVTVDDVAVVSLLRERATPLEEAGIALLLPSWWTRRAKPGLRAKAAAPADGPVVGAGLGMDALVSFSWEAALGERRLTKAELATLAKAAEAKQALVRIRGEWVEVDATQLDRVLARAGRQDQATAADLIRAGMGLDTALGPDLVGVDASAVGWLDALLGDALHATVEPVTTPPGFNGVLRPYQERGAGWLAFLGRLGLGACLADDMGLGKTAQLIATMLADPADGPTLVVCPVSVLGNWAAELERFAPDLRVAVHHGVARRRAQLASAATGCDVVLTTYSLLARDADELGSVAWGRLVLDEAQQIKNAGTGQARAARSLPAGRRVAMTGTPVENRLSDLWSIMETINPGLLGSRRSFRERFAIPIERDQDSSAAERLRRITQPFVLRRLKTDRSIITDLPDKIETVDRCPLTREQATLYRAVVDDLLADADESEGIERRGRVLAGLLRLKQVCNHPAHFLDDGSTLPGRSGKLTRTEELLEEIVAEGESVLCFTQFAAWGHRLAPYFVRRFGVEVLWLHGGVPRGKRQKMVDRFQAADQPRVFLVSLKAGGSGLNLTAASHVVHLDRWWNPAVEDQATDRAYRIGQLRNVQVHKLVSTGTVEERIDELIAAKRELAGRVIGAGEEWLTGLSTGELRDLVALREDG